MNNLKLEDIIRDINYIKVIGNTDILIGGFNKDTRTINKYDLYFGIKGENFDGNKFYLDAINNGASACILDNIDDLDESSFDKDNHAIIVVKDSVKALQEAAAYLRSKIKVPVIAITGSAGKTSTKDMMAASISTKYKVFKSRQNLNNEIGCPLMISEYKGEDIMILEMGTSSIGEIDVLSRMARPNIAVITNIGNAHIGLFGNKENTLKAKTEIINGMDKDGVLFFNNDDPLLHKYYLENKDKINIITYGIENKSDVMPEEVKEYYDHSTIIINNENVIVPIGGKHFVYNALACIAVALHLGISADNVSIGLSNLQMSNNRMNMIKINGCNIINDAYNANPEAMKYALTYLNEQIGSKLAVLGSMKELGDYTKELHEEIAKHILTLNLSAVYTIGDEMKYAYDYLVNNSNGTMVLKHFETRDELLEEIKKEIRHYDNILLKGSNSLGLFKMIDEL